MNGEAKQPKYKLEGKTEKGKTKFRGGALCPKVEGKGIWGGGKSVSRHRNPKFHESLGGLGRNKGSSPHTLRPQGG